MIGSHVKGFTPAVVESKPKPFKSHAICIDILVAKYLSSVAHRRGFSSLEILKRWPEIVGFEVSRHTSPSRLLWPRVNPAYRPEDRSKGTGAALEILVSGPAIVELPYLKEQILARVNSYLGFQAVTHMKIKQASFSIEDLKSNKPVVSV